jgi:secondary thiamine-phosphate synthase enzyme
MQTVLSVQTSGAGLHEITPQVADWAARSRRSGLLTLFLRHSSASLLVQENADPDVCRDLDAFFRRLVPAADDPAMAWLTHISEGPDDMPAHIRAALLPVSLSIPVSAGRLALGTWQGIWLFEHRTRGRRREIALHLGA